MCRRTPGTEITAGKPRAPATSGPLKTLQVHVWRTKLFPLLLRCHTVYGGNAIVPLGRPACRRGMSGGMRKGPYVRRGGEGSYGRRPGGISHQQSTRGHAALPGRFLPFSRLGPMSRSSGAVLSGRHSFLRLVNVGASQPGSRRRDATLNYAKACETFAALGSVAQSTGDARPGR